MSFHHCRRATANGIAFRGLVYTVLGTAEQRPDGRIAGHQRWDGTFGGMDHRPHIVVVEDEAAQRQLLVDYLGRQNFRVSGADGGTALRKLLERELPALVLLDVGLSGEGGFGLARWARACSAAAGVSAGVGSPSSWCPPPPTRSTASSGSRPARTITSRNPSSRAN